MRVIVWISEGTWEACVAKARELLPEEAEVTLVHVTPVDPEELAAAHRGGLLGRHPPPAPGPEIRALSAEQASRLLTAARERFGRPASIEARQGAPERELLAACAEADLLVLARDGKRDLGPKSLGRSTRFVLDHVPCEVLLLWSEKPPGLDTVRLPPHLRR